MIYLQKQISLEFGGITMTLGDRIKKIRVFRHMTMDELGAALGFEGKAMSVRISQYEAGTRVPKKELLHKIADALRCNYKALDDYSLGSAEDIIETLFWLEESSVTVTEGRGKHFPEYVAPNGLITLSEMSPVNDDKDVKMTFNDNSYNASGLPVAVMFNYGLVNDFLIEWNQKKQDLALGRISAYEYFEWKIMWPNIPTKTL